MSDVIRIDLFISKFSKHSIECVKSLSSKGVTPNIIPLDTKRSRERAMRGKYISITQVPSMVVVKETGEAEVYVGKIKILRWVNAMLQSRTQSEEMDGEQPTPIHEPPKESELYKESSYEGVHKPRMNYSSQPNNSYSSVGEGGLNYEIPVPGDNASSSFEDPQTELPVEDFEFEPESELASMNSAGAAPNGNSMSLSTGAMGPKPPPKMQSLKDAAKQMERARMDSLGYDEAKLPK